MVALMCLSSFAFLRVGEAASIPVAYIRGEKDFLLSGLPKEGSLAGDGAGGPSGRGPGVNTCEGTRRAGMATNGWFRGDLRFLKARWRVSSKGRSGRMGGGMVTAGGGGAAAWARGPPEAWFLSLGG